mgnify:CR=1 FL=1
MLQLLANYTIIIGFTILATFVATRAWHVRSTRLFVAVIVALMLMNILTSMRFHVSAPQIGYVLASLSLIIMGMLTLLMFLLLSALFVPEWWLGTQPVRWIALPYISILIAMSLDVTGGMGWFVNGVYLDSIGIYRLQTVQPGGWLLHIAATTGWLVQLTMLIVAFWREPRFRLSISLIFLSLLIPTSISLLPATMHILSGLTNIFITVPIMGTLTYVVLKTNLVTPTHTALDLVIQSMSEVVAVLDTHQAVVYVNPSALKLGIKPGCKLNVLLEQHHVPVDHTESLDHGLLAWYTTRSEDQPVQLNGRSILFAHTPVIRRRGKQLGTLLLGRDVTDLEAYALELAREREQLAATVQQFEHEQQERIRITAAAQASETLLRTLVESMDDIVFMLDRDQRYTRVFGRWMQGYGLGADYFLGKTPADTAPDEATAALHMAANARALAGEYTVYECSIGDPSTYIQTSISPIRTDDGEIVGLVGVGRDITERKRMEEVLRASEEQHTSILATMHEGFLLYDDRGMIKEWNRRAEQILEVTADQLRSRLLFATDWNTIREDGHPFTSDTYPLTLALRTGQPFSNVVMGLQRTDGGITWILINAHPLFRNAELRPYAGFAIFSDITERKQAEQSLQQANVHLTHWVSQLEQRTHEITLLSTMSDMLQTCCTDEEAAVVIAQIGPQLFPNTSGALYTVSASRVQAEAIATWGNLPLPCVCTPDTCWSLRRGRLHLVQETCDGPACIHLPRPLPFSTLCIPMIAQGETLGMYQLCHEQGVFSEPVQQLAVTAAEHIGLALANMRLREALRYQAIRDPLTGLYNRRYMEEALERELHRARRHAMPIAVLMLDVDHFKRFNDTFGHAAGDVVLRELGCLFQSSIRGEDIACRYGGEEFILIFVDAPLDVVQQRAEEIRKAVRQLSVVYCDQSLGIVTISLGLAMFPEHSVTVEELLHRADAALYQAKVGGRNRLVVATSSVLDINAPFLSA